jgi:hypothetical protein
MPRVYIQKKPGRRRYENYTEETMRKCLEEVASGEISIRAAAKKYSIPRATINNKQKGSHGSSVGRKRVFTDVEENLFEYLHPESYQCVTGVFLSTLIT